MFLLTSDKELQSAQRRADTSPPSIQLARLFTWTRKYGPPRNNRIQVLACCLLLIGSLFGFLLDSYRGSDVSLKRRLSFTGLHDVISKPSFNDMLI
jgi:hypothetical protein